MDTQSFARYPRMGLSIGYATRIVTKKCRYRPVSPSMLIQETASPSATIVAQMQRGAHN